MKKNQKGFTLAELLIVVAVIAVLVAIAIPTFTNQLEKSRQAVDISNLRGAYAAAKLAAMDGTYVQYKEAVEADPDAVPPVEAAPESYATVKLDGTANKTEATLYYDPATGGLCTDAHAKKLSIFGTSSAKKGYNKATPNASVVVDTTQLPSYENASGAATQMTYTIGTTAKNEGAVKVVLKYSSTTKRVYIDSIGFDAIPATALA